MMIPVTRRISIHRRGEAIEMRIHPLIASRLIEDHQMEIRREVEDDRLAGAVVPRDRRWFTRGPGVRNEEGSLRRPAPAQG